MFILWIFKLISTKQIKNLNCNLPNELNFKINYIVK